jgi:hypothetical protein
MAISCCRTQLSSLIEWVARVVLSSSPRRTIDVAQENGGVCIRDDVGAPPLSTACVEKWKERSETMLEESGIV